MIKIITGDSAVFNFAIVYPGAVDGLPTPDLSNTSVVFALEKDSFIIKKTITNSDTNILTYTLSPEETASMKPGKYKGCCKIYYGEEATTVWMDTIIVIKGVLGADD